MISKYFNGVIEQVYSKVGIAEKNIVMACYSNDFSVVDLELLQCYSEADDGVFFTWYEYEHDAFVGAYDPFLDIICEMYHRYISDSFDKFLEDCGVYYLHRPIFKSYFETGVCKRTEEVILNEVDYEQQRMTEAIVAMLNAVATCKPLVIVINRFQMASPSTMLVIRQLLENPTSNIGIVLGANESQKAHDISTESWEKILDELNDLSQLYHLGNTGRMKTASNHVVLEQYKDTKFFYSQLCNIVELLDYEQAKYYLAYIEKRIKFEGAKVPEENLVQVYLLYARVSIFLSDVSKALGLLEGIMRLECATNNTRIKYDCEILLSRGYMYQGRLDDAIEHAKIAKEEAQKLEEEKLIFEAELIFIQAEMSGWHNIFFCVEDVVVDNHVIECAIKYGYKNHLAHIYIYAYDNRPEIVALSYRTEAALVNFSKGLEIAKNIGNARLVQTAYKKNVMIAATNGMNEIALLYAVRTYQYIGKFDDYESAHVFMSIGYNLSAIGKNVDAERYYDKAIEMFYYLGKSEDIAEAHYNRALNAIMMGDFSKAESNLLFTMKTIEKLHLNSIRVCNLSKLYGLLAIVCGLQGNKFNTERYLQSCSKFIDYMLEKKEAGKNSEYVHDYEKCDDDMFLYFFAKALFMDMEGKEEEAYGLLEKAEELLRNSEGNQFHSYRWYRELRMKYYKKFSKNELYKAEKDTLEGHLKVAREIRESYSEFLLEELEIVLSGFERTITEDDIEQLLKQNSLAKNFQTVKRQMEFVASWQKLIDVENVTAEQTVQKAVRTFLNEFNIDNAIYVRYSEDEPKVLFNNTKCKMDGAVLNTLDFFMKECPSGFAVSKAKENFYDYRTAIEPFGTEDICSILGIPVIEGNEVKAYLIAYIQMKDNWHSSMARYLLDESDLDIYRLLFRELNYCLNRIEANERVLEMNRILSDAAVKDMLTNVYNRAGLYQKIDELVKEDENVDKHPGIAIMFLDLDNFKPYNDTFGHEAGDIVLKCMADIFRQSVGHRGFVSRYGGDEFILVVQDSDKELLKTIAEDVYRRIEASNGFKGELEAGTGRTLDMRELVPVTCSIGIAISEGKINKEDCEALIQMADDILYSIKTEGKGTYRFL